MLAQTTIRNVQYKYFTQGDNYEGESYTEQLNDSCARTSQGRGPNFGHGEKMIFFGLLWILANVNGDSGEMCREIPERVLGDILGAAFNARYMSITSPPEEIEIKSVQSTSGSVKRAPSALPSFYVDDDYSREIGEEPAWQTSHIDFENVQLRKKRRSPDYFYLYDDYDLRNEAKKQEKTASPNATSKLDVNKEGIVGKIVSITDKLKKLVKRDVPKGGDERVVFLTEKRSIKNGRQWECLSRIRWLDLGPDYFPR